MFALVKPEILEGAWE